MQSVSALGFDTEITTNDGHIVIVYETWENNVGIHTVLTLSADNPGSLCITQWNQIN